LVYSIMLISIKLSFTLARCTIDLTCRLRHGKLREIVRMRRDDGVRADANDDVEPGSTADNPEHIEDRVLGAINARWFKIFGDPSKAAEVVEVVEDEQGPRTERLDTSFIEDDDQLGGAAAGGAAPDDAGDGAGGKGLRIRDDLLTALSIDDYMYYRVRPLCTYFERTAPWRAFELQCLEIIVFVFNSSGAVLVGVSDNAVPFVALTVATASVCKAFIEFSRLDKQVEAYNSAQRDLHNMINKWDGMTRTERRTRSTITEVTETVESAMMLVATALTDAIPGQGTKGGGGDGAEDEDGE